MLTIQLSTVRGWFCIGFKAKHMLSGNMLLCGVVSWGVLGLSYRLNKK